MRQQRDADAERLKLRDAFVNAAGDAALVQIEREGETAYAAADDGYVHPGFLEPCPCRTVFGLNGRDRRFPVNIMPSGGIIRPNRRKIPMDKALYDRGLAMRRKVLGDEYVDRAIANTDDFNRDFQNMLNEFAWGSVWGDDRLAPRDRSILNLGMIACLGRMHEFEAHFKGALRNGVTQVELAAILRQVAIYCGFPAAVDAHRIAKKVLAEEAGKTG
jgi:4-carboxymuconolactone decarboxylase